MKLPAGSLGRDFAAPSLNPPAEIAAAGHRFVCRYIAGGQPRPKVITADEVAALHACGIGIILNWEWAITDALGGAVRGDAHGRMAGDMARSLGYPASMPIVVSVDTDVTISNRVMVEQYCRAFAAVCGYPVGFYGGEKLFPLVADLSILNWKANAFSWSIIPPGWPAFTGQIHIRQGRQSADHAYDLNTMLTEVEVWLPEKEVDMPKLVLWRPKGYANVFVTDGTSSQAASAKLIGALGVDPTVVIVDEHTETLKSILAHAGLDLDDLTPIAE